MSNTSVTAECVNCASAGDFGLGYCRACYRLALRRAFKGERPLGPAGTRFDATLDRFVRGNA